MKYFLIVIFVFPAMFAEAQQYDRRTNNNVVYTDSAAKAEIERFYKQIQQGADFANMAIQHSQDPGSYKSGGLLNTIPLDWYVEPYRDVLLTLIENEISKPFRTTFGYHIVQLVSKKDGQYVSRHILLRVD